MTRPIIPHKHRRIVGIAIVLVAIGVLCVLALRPDPNDVLPTTSDTRAELQTMPLPAPAEIAALYGNLSPDETQRALVARVGGHIVQASDAARSRAEFRFYLLADQNRINVFALPDGSVFITTLLLNHLKTEAQLAAMLAHEVAQVTARHRPYYPTSSIVTYTRGQEQVADITAVKYMAQAGYNPNALIDTLSLLRDIHETTPVEFYQSHPSPNNRIARIEYAIKQQFPDGVPDSLSK
jgi:predicted Zn-dependent protease